MRPWRAVPFLLLASVQAMAVEPASIPMNVVTGYRYRTVVSEDYWRQIMGAVQWLNDAPNASERKRRRQEFDQAIAKAARTHGIDRKVLETLLLTESGFRHNAVSSKGAMGLGQLMPGTAAELGVSDPFDPEENIDAAAYYLSKMLERFGSLKLALAAYNAGPDAVEKYRGVPPYKETRAFVEKIMGRVSEPPEKDFFVVSK